MAPKRPLASEEVETLGLEDRLVVEINPRARRLSLRVEPARDCVVLIRPGRVSEKAVAIFVLENLDWIRRHLGDLPPRIPFSAGSVIPYRGTDHVIAARPESKRGVWRKDGIIFVAGHAEHTRRRVTDWLKSAARSQIVPLVNDMAGSLGQTATRITLRDMRSRWGSCARGGRLSFSWRLILASEAVLTYVAAHEVAHLKHANHGAAFKRAVAGLLEPYGVDMASARKWLGRCGASLHRYG